jgi:hypothetical protein
MGRGQHTPAEEEQLEEDVEGAVVENEEVDSPLEDQADDLEKVIAAPEELHTKAGHTLLPGLLADVAREGGVHNHRVAVAQNAPPRMPLPLGLRCHERRRHGRARRRRRLRRRPRPIGRAVVHRLCHRLCGHRHFSPLNLLTIRNWICLVSITSQALIYFDKIYCRCS